MPKRYILEVYNETKERVVSEFELNEVARAIRMYDLVSEHRDNKDKYSIDIREVLEGGNDTVGVYYKHEFNTLKRKVKELLYEKTI